MLSSIDLFIIDRLTDQLFSCDQFSMASNHFFYYSPKDPVKPKKLNPANQRKITRFISKERLLLIKNQLKEATYCKLKVKRTEKKVNYFDELEQKILKHFFITIAIIPFNHSALRLHHKGYTVRLHDTR